MVGERAAEAEGVTAVTADGGDDAVEVFGFHGAIYCKLAVWGGTPLEIVSIIDVCPRKQLVVSTRG